MWNCLKALCVAIWRVKRSRQHLLYGVIIVGTLLVCSFRLATLSLYRSNGQIQYYRAQVVALTDTSSAGQKVNAQLRDGPESGTTVQVLRPVNFGDANYKRLPVGSLILLTKSSEKGSDYVYYDRWHLPGVATLFIILLILIALIGMWRGITSVVGLGVSILILSCYVVPHILAGQNAFVICIIGATLITITSIYIAHGISARTTVAFISSLLVLLLIIGSVELATYLTGTSEVIDESSLGLLYGNQAVHLSNLLTGGTIIASLGVLYDITTGQSAAVDELYKSKVKQSFTNLYKRGMSVGREHIAALINTLALVYVGLALPSIVITALYSHAPLLVVFNNESTVEEVVRTFVACAATLLAIPITTAMAAYSLPRWYQSGSVRQFKRWLQAL